jgi:hypothetical protein
VKDKDKGVKAKQGFLGLREDNESKAVFNLDSDLTTFWGEVSPEYPILSDISLKLLAAFATKYPYEVIFSTMVSIKTKTKNALDFNDDFRCALAISALG